MLHLLLLLLATPASPETRCRPGAEQATTQLGLADRAAEHRDYKAENAALDGALHALGDAYTPPTTIDDTGMHLVLAGAQQRRGKLKVAAELKRRVLVERMQLCRQRVPSSPLPATRTEH